MTGYLSTFTKLALNLKLYYSKHVYYTKYFIKILQLSFINHCYENSKTS